MPTLPPHPALVSLWCSHSLSFCCLSLVLCTPGTLWPWSCFFFLKCISQGTGHSQAFFPSPHRDYFLRGFSLTIWELLSSSSGLPTSRSSPFFVFYRTCHYEIYWHLMTYSCTGPPCLARMVKISFVFCCFVPKTTKIYTKMFGT